MFDRRVDPVELRLKAAAIVVSLATGPVPHPAGRLAAGHGGHRVAGGAAAAQRRLIPSVPGGAAHRRPAFGRVSSKPGSQTTRHAGRAVVCAQFFARSGARLDSVRRPADARRRSSARPRVRPLTAGGRMERGRRQLGWSCRRQHDPVHPGRLAVAEVVTSKRLGDVDVADIDSGRASRGGRRPDRRVQVGCLAPDPGGVGAGDVQRGDACSPDSRRRR